MSSINEIQDVPTNWTQTYSGFTLDLDDPKEEQINIIDICHGISHVCRYSGQCQRFYSVLEHVLNVYKLLKIWEPTNYQLQLNGLLHDSAEAYITDLVNPVKILCPQYKTLEVKLEAVIAKKFKISHTDPMVRKADLVVLDFERKMLFNKRFNWKLPYDYMEEPGTESLWISESVPKSNLLKLEFMEIFHSLTNKLGHGTIPACP